ncbi:hypothetical protein FRAHR75_350016 [Frankia sp. Hr75.2]|nr:hypothetical protein FRAHR75_350016 [Frankia sp. Hr75.2]
MTAGSCGTDVALSVLLLGGRGRADDPTRSCQTSPSPARRNGGPCPRTCGFQVTGAAPVALANLVSTPVGAPLPLGVSCPRRPLIGRPPSWADVQLPGADTDKHAPRPTTTRAAPEARRPDPDGPGAALR